MRNHTLKGFWVASFLSLTWLSFANGQNGVTGSATIQMPEGTVGQGDRFNVSISLSKPTRCPRTIRVTFRSQDPGMSFFGQNSLKAGETSLTAEVQVPRDIPPGVYTATDAYLFPCEGYIKEEMQKLRTPRSVTVTAVPDQPLEAAEADLTLSFNQKQFFSTEIRKFQAIEQEITTKLAKSFDSPDARAFLLQKLIEGDKQLSETEEQYKHNLLRKDDKNPAFFADLHSQFNARRIDVLAPIPGVGVAGQYQVALIRTQEIKRRPGTGDKQPLAGILPPMEISVIKLFRDCSSVLKYVRDTGRITFDMKIASLPKDAHIRYWKLIQPLLKSDFSQPTDIEKATFELATWVFEFSTPECTDKPVIQIDPYQDTNPEETIEFRKCRRNR